MLLEVVFGVTTFQTHDSGEHLAMIEALCGPIPPHMLKKALLNNVGRDLVDDSEMLIYYNSKTTKASQNAVRKVRKLSHQINSASNPSIAGKEDLLLDLASKLLQCDPHKRCTSEQALKHPFFN